MFNSYNKQAAAYITLLTWEKIEEKKPDSG